MIGTVRRVRWKNIFGLLAFIVVVFVIVTLVSLLSIVIYGDCVQKGNVKACFSVADPTLGTYESTSINVEVSNAGESMIGAEVSMTISPNLKNMSSLVQKIDKMAPGDKVERIFEVSSKGELGDFTVDFDINGDGIADKEISLRVE